jgi:uncharacterized protein
LETVTASEVTELMLAKEAALKASLAAHGAVAVAYSGGVDSSYLADIAYEALGANAHMVIADSPSIPREELAEARALAAQRGWTLHIIETREFDNEAFLKNDGTRCYYCKSELFTRMKTFAEENGIHVIAYGEIADDALDPTRLGSRAARELQAVAPLADAGLGKEEIRALSKRRGLPTWDKASFACLSSRFPKGNRLNIEEMLRVERAEQVLKSLGFRQYRARHHGDLCRIELDPADFAKLLEGDVRTQIIDALRKVGYRHVTLDLAGYRTGSTAT